MHYPLWPASPTRNKRIIFSSQRHLKPYKKKYCTLYFKKTSLWYFTGLRFPFVRRFLFFTYITYYFFSFLHKKHFCLWTIVYELKFNWSFQNKFKTRKKRPERSGRFCRDYFFVLFGYVNPKKFNKNNLM